MDPAQLPPYELGMEGEQRDRLVGLARWGVKTMTSSLLVHDRMDDEDLPLPAQHLGRERWALTDDDVVVVEVFREVPPGQ